MHTVYDITVPTLVLNAVDDPVCVIANVDDNVDLLERNHNGILLRMPAGGHCGFLAGLSARHWGFDMGMRFMLAVLQDQKANQPQAIAA